MNKLYAMLAGYTEEEAEMFSEFQESDVSFYQLIGIDSLEVEV